MTLHSLNSVVLGQEQYDYYVDMFLAAGVLPEVLKSEKLQLDTALGSIDGLDGYTIEDLEAVVEKKGWQTFVQLYRTLKLDGFSVFSALSKTEKAAKMPADNFLYGVLNYTENAPVPLTPKQHTLEFVKALVELRGYNYIYLPEEFWAMSEIQLAAIKSDSGVLNHVLHYGYNDFEKNKERILKILFQNKDLNIDDLVDISNDGFTDFRLDSENIIESLRAYYQKKGEKLFAGLPTDALVELVLLQLQTLKYLNPEQLADVWPEVRARLQKKGLCFPEEWMQSYELFLAGVQKDLVLRSFNSFENLYNVWVNMQQPFALNDPRPAVLFVVNRADSNKAFDQDKILNKVIESGKYRVLYLSRYEEDVLSEENLRMLTGNRRKLLSYLFILGHGRPTRIMLGDPPLEYEHGETSEEEFEKIEKYFLDVKDIESGQFSYMPSYLMSKGHLYMISCSVGKGGEAEEDNLVNQWANIFSPEFSVYGYDRDAVIRNRNTLDQNMEVRFTSAGELLFYTHQFPLYIAKGRKTKY